MNSNKNTELYGNNDYITVKKLIGQPTKREYKMKKLFAISLSIMIALLFVGCQNSSASNNDTSDKQKESISSVVDSSVENSVVKDIYSFYDYENEDVFDIEKIDLSSDLEAACTTYKFSYLSDNYEIKAYISIPVSSIETQKPCKCILYNRGGNSRIGLLEEDETAVICSISNRIVIASQYRGAGGSEGTDQFGGDDLHDVIKLIDLCENHFSFVDMDNFCAVGVSRGGIMTYMAARQDNRIKRIIVVSAVSDLFQSYEEREDMQQLLNNYIGCTPEENPSEYEKRSAIYWTDEIKIPVLIIHSKQDEQVSFEQAEKMYEKLKNITDCTFITHEDNVHGFHEEDIPTIVEWLEKN